MSLVAYGWGLPASGSIVAMGAGMGTMLAEEDLGSVVYVPKANWVGGLIDTLPSHYPHYDKPSIDDWSDDDIEMLLMLVAAAN